MDQPSTLSRNNFIVSLGQSSTSQYSDTWSLDLSTLTWQRLNTTGTQPSARYDTSGGIDPKYKLSSSDSTYLISSHGTDGYSYFQDTYILELSTLQSSNYTQTSAEWQRVDATGHIPSQRSGAASTIYPPHTLIMQGGCEFAKLGPCISNEIYELTLQMTRSPTQITINESLQNSTNTKYQAVWRQSIQSSMCPGKRASSTLSFIPSFSTRLLILYGGNYGDYSGPLGQVGVQDTTETWTTILPATQSNSTSYPDARQMSGLISAYNPFNLTSSYDVYMFGGNLTPRSFYDGSMNLKM